MLSLFGKQSESIDERTWRKSRRLAEKSVISEHDQALSADNLQGQTSFEIVSKMSEHFENFCPAGTYMFPRECG